MFILTTFSDLVQIQPSQFHKRNRDVLEEKINEKFANKVVSRVGLCVCLYDILKASDGLIGHGTGNANVNVEFRMIVFRPFKGEIIHGTIQKCTPNGLQIHTEFFSDIYVPSTMLFDGCSYDEEEKVWIWETSGTQIYCDIGTLVRIRVEKETWHNQTDTVSASVNDNLDVQALATVPFSITASMAEPGLGGIDWWD